MKQVVYYDNLRSFCYCSDHLVKQPIRGIVIDFMGLGGTKVFDEDPDQALQLAQHGLIYIIPYANPWNWMNQGALNLSEAVLAAVREHYDLPRNTPVVACGGSMGGLNALIYTRYAPVAPVACVTNCPVCDLVYHYTERPDLPRTLYSAFWDSKCDTMEEALAVNSPMHQVEQMPGCDYVIFHCTADRSVNIEKHSERFVAAMRKKHSVTYYTVPDRGHCDLDDDMRQVYWQSIIDAFADKELR